MIVKLIKGDYIVVYVLMNEQEREQFFVNMIDALFLLDTTEINLNFLPIIQELGSILDVDRIAYFSVNEKRNYVLEVLWHNLGVQEEKSKTYVLSPTDLVNIFSEDLIKIDNSHDHFLTTYPFKTHIKPASLVMIPIKHQDQWLGLMCIENIRFNDSFDFTSNKMFLRVMSIWKYVLLQHRHTHGQHNESHVSIETMSHEMRTPLGQMVNALYLLQTTDLSKEQQAYIKMGQDASDKLSATLEQLVDTKAYDQGYAQLKPLDVDFEDEMIRLTLLFKRKYQDKPYEFNLSCDYHLFKKVKCDIQKVHQLITHLIQNHLSKDTKTVINITYHAHKHAMNIMLHISSDTPLKNEIDSYVHDELSSHLIAQLASILHMELTVNYNNGIEYTLNLPVTYSDDLIMNSMIDKVVAIYPTVETFKYTDMLTSLKVKLQNLDDLKVDKADLILFDGPLKPSDSLLQIKELFGKPDVITLASQQIDLKRLKKVDGTLEFPISRQMFLHKWQMYDKKIIKQKTTDYHKALHGRVMIVDDNRLNRIALHMIVNKLGLETIIMESGQKAIDYIKHNHADLILMDIQMPMMDGIETTRRIRSLGKQMPIVAVTANAYFNDYDMLKSSQINDVLFKPIKIESLQQTLSRFLVKEETLLIPLEIKIFDHIDFMNRFEDSLDIAKDMIKTYLDYYQDDFKRIKQMIETNHSENIYQSLHYFKGSCSYLSAKRMVWLIDYMLKSTKTNKLEAMDALYELLVEENDKLMHELTLILQKL